MQDEVKENVTIARDVEMGDDRYDGGDLGRI